MNEIRIKRAVRAGNSSAVILPRAWLNKEVRVELIKKTNQMIFSDVLGILDERFELSKIIGIYLVGSYARGEEDSLSDIDILVVTHGIDLEIIHQGQYNILVISSKLLEQKLKSDLFPIGQMIREAKPLLNFNYIEPIDVNITTENIKWYLDTTKEKLELVEKIISWAKEKKKNNLSDRIAYTLILRIRTLYIINCIRENKKYSKHEFIRELKRIKGIKNAYERYMTIKNDLNDKNNSSLEEIIALYDYLATLYRNTKNKIE
jgi:predicted nucleotidyltransferase